MPEHDFVRLNDIYGVIDGKIAWRIQDQVEYDENYKPFQSPYTLIYPYDKDTSLFGATSASGFCFLVDPLTGKIVGEDGWVK